MANRILDCADGYTQKIKDQATKETALIELEKSLSVTFQDHFDYQQLQARSHALGTLTTEEAQTIYIALGEAMSTQNGGWQSHVKLPLKIAITLMIEKLAKAALVKQS